MYILFSVYDPRNRKGLTGMDSKLILIRKLNRTAVKKIKLFADFYICTKIKHSQAATNQDESKEILFL